MRRAAQRHVTGALLVALCAASVSLAALRVHEPARAGRAGSLSASASLAGSDDAFVHASPDRIARGARAIDHRWTPLLACLFLGLIGLGGAVARRAGAWPDLLTLTLAATCHASPRAPPSSRLAASR